MRPDQPVREQVQAQVGVVRVGRRLGERADHRQRPRRCVRRVLVVARPAAASSGGPSLCPSTRVPGPPGASSSPAAARGTTCPVPRPSGSAHGRQPVAPRALLRRLGHRAGKVLASRRYHADPRLLEVEVALDPAHHVLAHAARRCAAPAARRARPRSARAASRRSRAARGGRPRAARRRRAPRRRPRSAPGRARAGAAAAPRAAPSSSSSSSRSSAACAASSRAIASSGEHAVRARQAAAAAAAARSVSPWPSSVTSDHAEREQQDLRALLRPRAGTASAAASEIAPRMPAQPTTIRSRTLSPRPPTGISVHGIRTAITVSGDRERLQRRASPTSSSSASRGACRPSRTNSSASRPNIITLPEGDRRRAACRRPSRECAFQPRVDAARDGGEHARRRRASSATT